ncbi:MAG: hypothetical protein QNJ67_11490 [Kiloniellales bacterium]|nr:hypothetical protein [Kiloniellales bacterium]
MRSSEALDRAQRYSTSRPFLFAGTYWAIVGIVLALLFHGFKVSSAAADGDFSPMTLALALLIGAASIFGISFYLWLYLTNPYRLRDEMEIYHALRLIALLGFGAIILIAMLVFHFGG